MTEKIPSSYVQASFFCWTGKANYLLRRLLFKILKLNQCNLYKTRSCQWNQCLPKAAMLMIDSLRTSLLNAHLHKQQDEYCKIYHVLITQTNCLINRVSMGDGGYYKSSDRWMAQLSSISKSCVPVVARYLDKYILKFQLFVPNLLLNNLTFNFS